MTAESRVLLSIFAHYDRGVLPQSGGLFDQPALVIQAMEAIFAARAMAAKG